MKNRFYNADSAFTYFLNEIRCNGIEFGDTKALFNVGDTVNIDSKKGLLVGTITKMNRTRAICEIKGKAYNVPFGMMEAV